MPVKDSVKVLAIATAGFAKDVEEVNQYPAVIYKPTDAATVNLPDFIDPNIISIKPKVVFLKSKRGLTLLQQQLQDDWENLKPMDSSLALLMQPYLPQLNIPLQEMP